MKPSFYSHYYLYAKHHYQRRNLIEDLKKIHGRAYGYDAKHVIEGDIVQVLLSLVWEHYMGANHTEHPNGYSAFLQFVVDCSPYDNWKVGGGGSTPIGEKSYEYYEAVIRKCLSMLCFVKVLDENKVVVLQLEKPDPTLLPLNKPKKAKKRA